MDLDNLDFDENEFHRRDDDDDGEAWKTKALEEHGAALKKLSRQILKTVMALIETIPDKEGEMAADYRDWMMENAMKIGAKLAGAMGVKDYMILRENAVLIKLAARELLTQTSGLEMFDYPHQDYITALRSEIEEFRKLFVKWVRAFPEENEIWPDGWGLFYTEQDVEKWNTLNPTETVDE